MLEEQCLRDRLARARHEIAAAAARAGRDPAGVAVVAVTKTFPPETVQQVAAAAIADVGENYVQEAREKRRRVAAALRWHLIGGLQRNKVRAAVATFDCIHSVDSVPLARALAAEVGCERILPVLIQVNVEDDPAKRGTRMEGAGAVVEAVLRETRLRLEGLMTIGREGSPDHTRGGFRMLRHLRDDLAHRYGVELPHLSMGMSDDFVIAVEEGATLVRLGRVLLGPRGLRAWREGA